MKATEIQELTNRFIALCDEAEFKGCTDPFRSFWQGFDIAVELALKAMKSMVNDATIANFEEETFDCILMDVPCSGLGDLAHKPEIKWHTTSNDLDEIVNIQASILENNWKAVKKEGYIVYSTCTLNKKENDKQISSFLSKHEEMKLIKEETIFPFMNNGDGFYVALMQRIG